MRTSGPIYSILFGVIKSGEESKFSEKTCNRGTWAELFKKSFHFYNSTLLALTLLFLQLLFTGIPPATANSVQIIGLLAGAGGLGDQSYNDMTFSGLGKAQKEYHFKLIVEETQSSFESQEASLQRLLRQGANVIVANGSGLERLVRTYSRLFPEKYFLVNDAVIENHPNVATTVFAHQEGSYLAGMLAALTTKTGSIGFIGGVDLPILRTFLDGYTKGARSVSSKIHIESTFISPLGDLSGFDNPALGLQLAVDMYSNGVDIIFSVAGLSGNGIIQAAQRQDKLVIGVDADQDHMAKGHVLTSMMKRLDRATYLEIVKIMQGKFEAGVNYYGLNNGGVSLTPMKYTRQLVPDSIIELLEQTERDIINGKIKI